MADITSPQNPVIKRLGALARRRREREDAGLAHLEGVRLAAEALAAGVRVELFVYTAELVAGARGAALVRGLQAAGARGYLATPAALARAAGTESPQGIVAAFRIPQRGQADLAGGLVLCADGLQDPGNLGTLARAGEALGAAGLACTAGTADPWGPKAVRAAMGSLFRLPVAQLGDTAGALAALRGRGFRVAVADPAGARLPWEVDWSGPVLLVVGNEGAGPSPAAVAAADVTVRIPMPGPAESLNAGVAGALLLYEALRQRYSADASSAR